MRFHLFMMAVLVAVSMTMHAMASAETASPVAKAAQAERYEAALQEAGGELNKHLATCRENAQRAPKASVRELKACERVARSMFRQDVRHARAQLRRNPAG